MDRAPLPPHERTWRHPSELAAEQRSALRSEVAPRTTRLVAFATGSAGLVAIALLMIVMTPDRSGQPLVVSATTSPSTPLQPVRAATTLIEQVRGFGRTAVTPARALATPIGSGTHAIVLSEALPDPLAQAIEVALPSGHESSAVVVERSGALVVVELDELTEPGHPVADRRPHDREIVTVMSSPPVTIAFADVHELEVAAGTAVLDSDGELVALCDDERNRPGTSLVEISLVEIGADVAAIDGDPPGTSVTTPAVATPDVAAVDDDGDPPRTTVETTPDDADDDGDDRGDDRVTLPVEVSPDDVATNDAP